MTGALVNLGAPGTLLSLLVLGHVLGDFVFQTEALVRRKHQTRYLLLHGVLVTLAQAVVLVVFPTPRVLSVVVVLGAVHLAIDATKLWATRRWGSPLGLFALDQGLHAATLVGAWWVLTRPGWQPVATLPGLGVLGGQGLAWATWAALVAAVFAFNHKGGNALVRAVLPEIDTPTDEDELQAGRIIGTLERYVTLILVLLGQWGALGLVIAAKSIARFQELKDRTFAEYYLIGTLTSVLVAVVSGVVLGFLV